MMRSLRPRVLAGSGRPNGSGGGERIAPQHEAVPLHGCGGLGRPPLPEGCGTQRRRLRHPPRGPLCRVAGAGILEGDAQGVHLADKLLAQRLCRLHDLLPGRLPAGGRRQARRGVGAGARPASGACAGAGLTIRQCGPHMRRPEVPCVHGLGRQPRVVLRLHPNFGGLLHDELPGLDMPLEDAEDLRDMELPELVVGQLVVQLASQRLCADRPNDLEDLCQGAWYVEVHGDIALAASVLRHGVQERSGVARVLP
mmetsp:Transcript_11415/g.32437  ORF Transcript_11415/g.32437 Transcript_11415/m.32437 type:complete len:254 (-) Transcript_11415:338-1099(-)